MQHIQYLHAISIAHSCFRWVFFRLRIYVSLKVYSLNQTVPTDSAVEKSILFGSLSPILRNGENNEKKLRNKHQKHKNYDFSTIWNNLPIDVDSSKYLLSQNTLNQFPPSFYAEMSERIQRWMWADWMAHATHSIWNVNLWRKKIVKWMFKWILLLHRNDLKTFNSNTE